MLCCPLSRLKRTGARSVWSNWTKSNVRQTDKKLSDERGQGNKHSLDFITMMGGVLAKIADLFFVVCYTSKFKLINTHCVVGTIRKERRWWYLCHIFRIKMDDNANCINRGGHSPDRGIQFSYCPDYWGSGKGYHTAWWEYPTSNKHSLDFITMMEWSLGKDSRLIFCCVLHFKIQTYQYAL